MYPSGNECSRYAPSNHDTPVYALPGTSSKKLTTMLCLPNDILLLIISFIRVRDILALRKTSKRFYTLTKLRWVWTDAVKRHIIDKGLPVPAIYNDMKMLSAEHLEARAVHAAKFHDNWYSKRPTPRRAVEFHVEYPPIDDPDGPRQSFAVDQVLFLRGRNGEFLVTVAGGIITCWEVPLDGSEAYRVAEFRDFNNAKIRQVIVNEDAKHDVEMAYWICDDRTNAVLIRTLSLDRFHGCFKMRTSVLGTKAQCTPLHAMYGDNIAMGNPLHVWHFPATSPAGRMSVMKLAQSPVIDESDGLLNIKFIGEYLLSVRERSIELFAIPPWSTELNRFENIRPLNACLQLDHAAREAVVVARSQAGRGYHGWPTDSVTVLMRYSDDGFDMIQQYDLLPNPRAQATQDSKQRQGEMDALPCVFPAEYTRVVSVAPSCCGLHVSQSGKGFWMQTRNVSTRRCIYPARCLIGFDVVRRGREEEEEEEEAGHVGEVGGSRPQAGDVTRENDLHVCEGELYSRRCDMSEIMWRKYVIVTADLEDTVGRIAVGDRDGKVVVLDYV